MVTFAQVIQAAHAFPGTQESTSYGTPALKVRGKLLARAHQSGDCFVLRTEFLDREILMQSDPAVFYITEHYRDYLWVLVRFAAVAASALPELIERAWRLVASHFTEQELIDLTLAITNINAWNRLNIAFRTVAGNYRPGMCKSLNAAAEVSPA